MTTLTHRGLILAGIGREVDWRRRYRTLVHMSVRHTIFCRTRIGLPAPTYQQVKVMLRRHAMFYFGVGTLREWLVEMRANRDYFEHCESFPNAADDDLILTNY